MVKDFNKLMHKQIEEQVLTKKLVSNKNKWWKTKSYN